MASTVTKIPYADTSPAEIRDALIPEEVEQFDREYRAALDEARENYRLDALAECLESWRRIAWMTTQHGPEAHRLMLARVDYTLTTWRRAPHGATATELAEATRQHAAR